MYLVEEIPSNIVLLNFKDQLITSVEEWIFLDVLIYKIKIFKVLWFHSKVISVILSTQITRPIGTDKLHKVDTLTLTVFAWTGFNVLFFD